MTAFYLVQVEREGDICQAAEDKMTPFGMAVSKGAQCVAEYFAEIGIYQRLERFPIHHFANDQFQVSCG